jgi:hypothetical protein
MHKTYVQLGDYHQCGSVGIQRIYNYQVARLVRGDTTNDNNTLGIQVRSRSFGLFKRNLTTFRLELIS